MMYRAKCTWILNEIRTIYHGKKMNVVRDANELYVEVHSEYEAELIEAANRRAIKQQYDFTSLLEAVRQLPKKPDICYLIVDGDGWVSKFINTDKDDALTEAQEYAKEHGWQNAGFIKVVELDLTKMQTDDIATYPIHPVEK